LNINNPCKINILTQGPQQRLQAAEDPSFGAWIPFGLLQDLFLGKPGLNSSGGRPGGPPTGLTFRRT
jgi:hypothetical protein